MKNTKHIYPQTQVPTHLPSYKTGFSDKLSLGDLIAAAGKYKSKFKASELENDFQVDIEGISDEQILHSAVGISRRDIEKLKISVEDYSKSQTTSRLL